MRDESERCGTPGNLNENLWEGIRRSSSGEGRKNMYINFILGLKLVNNFKWLWLDLTGNSICITLRLKLIFKISPQK